MATEREKPADSGVVGRLAGRGEDAITRLMEELGKNTMLTEALTRAMSAKKGLDAVSRGALAQAGLAAADDVRELRREIADLEKRLAKLEGAGKRQASRSRAAKASPARGGTTSRSRASRSTPSG